MARKQKQQQPDHAATIKEAARGHWAEILADLAGISADVLDGKAHPCPKCGGKDRFRFTNQDGDGSIICNQCARRICGDGLETIRWATGWTFPEIIRRMADRVGVDLKTGKRTKRKDQVDPSKDLSPTSWVDLVAGAWCLTKPPVTIEGLKTAGARLAFYRKRFSVIDLHVIGEGGAVVGHCLYNAAGGTLPKYTPRADGGWNVEQVKIKLTAGSKQPGWIGTVDRLATATVVWKVEGPSDVLAICSMCDLPSDVAVVTNPFGCGEKPTPWMAKQLAGKTVYVVGDADQPGQAGNIEAFKDWIKSQKVPDAGAIGWASAIAYHATEARNVVLPYELTETHGKDIRDWANEGNTYADLLGLAAVAATVAKPAEEPKLGAREAMDDPHRLARVNLERYATRTDGRTLVYWRSEWYVWKKNRYRRISEDDLRAKLTASIKREFDRAYLAGEQDDEGPVRRVTGGIVSNVMGATAGMTIISPEIEFGTWIEDRTRRSYVSMGNGILDIDAVMAGKDERDCLIPHSPKWFSTVSLPYTFDSNAGAEPPRWLAYLDRVMEGDQERIAILQEWAGYLLLPETGHQRFVVLEGDGANGKSVYGAAMTAMLGGDNVSNIQLEVFGDRFSRTETLGKLANICGDVGEIDKVSEGYVKSFTSGDRMYFDRKGISGLNVVPTARLMLACNTRPRFSDRSDGIWRRMILIPFRVQIPEKERVMGMDKSEWWEASGELPAILNWAVLGLARLRQQGHFSRSSLVDQAREGYRREMNPARMFLMEYVEVSGSSNAIQTRLLYHFYKRWAEESGFTGKLSDVSLGKEVARIFPEAKKERMEANGSRPWGYSGIRFSSDKICGEKVEDRQLLMEDFR